MLRMLAALCLLVLAILPAEAKRVALVFGNDSYPNLPDFRQLKKAVNDARAVRDTLNDDLGFAVSFAENADYRAMNNRIKQFDAGVEAGDIVFVYFSGHGVSIGGENFLLPSDIPRPVQGEEQRLMGSSFGAEQLILKLQKRGARAIYTVLDACRDNPFEDETGKAVGGPAGLTKMDAAEGVFILFAAGVRQTALDRLNDADANPNSVFTRSLIPALKTGGLSQVDLAKRVYKEVKAAAAGVGHDQHPAYYDQIDGYVALKDIAAEPKKPDPPPQVSLAAQDWERVKDSGSVAVLKAFREKYRDDSIAVAQADEAIAALEKKVALVVPKEAQPEEVTKTPECDAALASVGGAEKCLKPGDAFSDCVGCPEMVVVPPGTFTMGSPENEANRFDNEGPQHEVTIAKPFAVSKFEITFDEWEACVDGGGCTGNAAPDGSLFGKGRRPVIYVSWNDAQEYVRWLSGKTGQNYRLLSETEWEYAARAGTTTAYSTGETITARQANFNSTTTVEVGKFAANRFGLQDMHGNVWEWVRDCYVDSYKGAPTDGSATKDGGGCERVIRGGGWFYHPEGLRSAGRFTYQPENRFFFLGFRIARTL